jgi:hypothetical protein
MRSVRDGLAAPHREWKIEEDESEDTVGTVVWPSLCGILVGSVVPMVSPLEQSDESVEECERWSSSSDKV